MKLYCVRHGEAVAALENPERPLTERGMIQVEAMAQQLVGANVHVMHMIHSQRLRARQTAEILAQALKPQLVTESASGLDETDSVDDTVEMIRYWHDDTMIVGHMPFMSRLVSALVLDDSHLQIINFPPGAVVCLEHATDMQWVINWVLTPDIIT
jgi:phosphohistidine phosphatase